MSVTQGLCLVVTFNFVVFFPHTVDTKYRYKEIHDLVTSFQQTLIESMDIYEQNNKSICVSYYLKKKKTKSNWLVRKIYEHGHKEEARKRILRQCDGEMGSVTTALRRRVLVVSNTPCCSTEEGHDSMLTLITDIDGVREY